MKEILTIGIGQCGVRLLTNLYTCLLTQHLIDSQGHQTSESQEYKPSYFQQEQEVYKPRCILVDSQSGLIDEAFSAAWGQLLQPENCPFSNQSTGNNYAKGFHSVYDQLKACLHDSIRRSIERCDSPQSIEMSFSVGGGTGSGLSAALHQYLQDEYPQLIKINYIVVPSGKVSDIVVEPYNAVLSLVNFQGEAKVGNVLLSNESTYLRAKTYGYPTTTYKSMNEIITCAMSDTTLGNRAGKRDFNYRKLLLDACPYPRTNFLGVSIAQPEENIKKIKSYRQLFQSKYILSGITKTEGNYFSIHPIIRGNLPDFDTEMSTSTRISKITNKFRSRNAISVSEWVQPVVPTHYQLTRYRKDQLTQSSIFNSVSIKQSLVRIVEDAQKLVIRMCFFHKFQEQGVSQEQLSQAINEIYSVIQDYEDMGSYHENYGEQSCDSSYCQQ